MRPDVLPRAAFLHVTAALGSFFLREPVANAANAKSSSFSRPVAITLPLQRCGGAFCTEYFVEGQRYRAVADTGSPFLLVDGSSCLASRWGCFDEAGTTSTELNDQSEEIYGGQDVGVEWRRGTLRFGGEMATSSTLSFAPINFGVVRSSVGKGGTQAIYLGLAKDRQPRIRPTFLEQTDIQSVSFDFVKERLTLARRPLISGDGIPLVDLRPLGAPVAPYACKVHRLVVNGQPVQLARSCVAVLDTGTTGLVISDSLYDSPELPLPGAAMREIQVDVLTEKGRVVKFKASSRRMQGTSNFPLIVTPVSLSTWFDRERDTIYRRRASRQVTEARVVDRELGSAPHVLFLGLAFMSNLRLTIDIDAQRLSAESVVPSRFDSNSITSAQTAQTLRL
ncbi:hypothetical protein AB1Y20_009920 [Prymnesium parvum]|uniref:Peptidase A1 domain-containing protein n=1 Tax=Prymnesium parvum TaxID=97485 RepID=A0AB34K7Y2_PRYPA